VKTNKMSRTILIAIILAALTTSMAVAAEGDQIDVTGYIMELNPGDSTITIDVDGDGSTSDDVYIILVGDNFDFDKHLVGDIITVQGTVSEDDVVILTELKIMERARDRVKLQDGELESNYCTSEEQHPVAAKVADSYGVDYSVIEGYLCGENPVPLGQIMLAMQTSALTGGDYTEYLDGFDGISWGLIWQEAGLQGKPDHGTPPGQLKKQDGEGDPEKKVPPGQQKKEGDGSLECEEGEILCEAYEWLQTKSKKGKK